MANERCWRPLQQDRTARATVAIHDLQSVLGHRRHPVRSQRMEGALHVAILEDDPVQREILQLLMQQGRHSCKTFETFAQFKLGMERESFDVALIDWMLPDSTGSDVLKWVRHVIGWQLPCIVITARHEQATVVAALEAGADDYLMKPAKPLELLARIGAALRRVRPAVVATLRAGDYTFDLERKQMTIAGAPVTLSKREHDLSVCLFKNIDNLVARDYLLATVWGGDETVDKRTVDAQVSRLRRKLKLDGSHGCRLLSVYGFGYRLERTVSD
jgi:DNA-binding response OmpR family regulator